MYHRLNKERTNCTLWVLDSVIANSNGKHNSASARLVIKKVMVSLAMILLIGCTSVKTVDLNQNRSKLVETIKINDRVIVQTKDNDKFGLTVMEIDKNKIVGKTRTVPIDDIVNLGVEKVSVAKTVGTSFGWGIVGIVALTSFAIVPFILFL